MKLFYYWSSDETRKPLPGEQNKGIDAVPALLTRLMKRGVEVELVDTAQASDRRRIEMYTRVALPAVYKHYEVKRMLGTNRHSACFFGAEVPALLVTDGDSVGDTYPHRKEDRIATIHAFLTGLLAMDDGGQS
jgi:hypothetical protein